MLKIGTELSLKKIINDFDKIWIPGDKCIIDYIYNNDQEDYYVKNIDKDFGMWFYDDSNDPSELYLFNEYFTTKKIIRNKKLKTIL